jgi:hypothetical protein
VLIGFGFLRILKVERRIDLVYGGGSLGLMGLVSQAVHDGGRHVLGLDSLSLLDPCIFEWQLKEACFTGHASFYLIIFTLPFGTLTLGCTQALFLCSINLLIIIVFPLEPCEFPNLLCIGIPIYQTCSKPDIMGSYGNLTFLISISFGTKNCVSSILIS